MRISAFFVPFFSLLAGVCGFFLRMSELSNVFDPVTGLPDRGAATTLWLISLSVAFLAPVIIFAVTLTFRHKAPRGFENAFGTDPVFYPVIFVLIGIAWIVGTYLYYSDISASLNMQMIEVYFIALSALAAICVTFFAIEMFQDSRRKAQYMLSIVPTIFFCFWLILTYRQNASNPVLLSYVYLCLALVSSALSFYFTSGFLYDKPGPGKATVAYCAAIYFCMVTLADDHHLSIKLILGAVIAANTVHLAMLLRNLQRR